MELRVERLEAAIDDAVLKNGGGDGTSGGMSGDWKDSVNAQLTQLHADVRNLLLGGLAAAVLLFGGLVTVYFKLSDQMTTVQVEQAKAGEKLNKVDDIDQKLDKLLDAPRSGRK